MERDPYEVLGVARTAPSEVIRAAWIAQSKLYHPDNGTAPDAERMAEINEAHELLIDHERREQYDAQHGPSANGSSGSGWEDDPVPTSGAAGWGDDVAAAESAPPAAPGQGMAPAVAEPVVFVSRPGKQLTPHEQGWNSAVHLAHGLRQGEPLAVFPTHLVLQQGEVNHCSVDAHLAAYHGMDVSYSSNSFIAGGSWTGLAVTGAASMAMNSRARRNAERQAAAQWRSYGVVPVHATNQRLLIMMEGRLESFWFNGGIAWFEPQFREYGMIIQADGGIPLRLDGPPVPYLAVILSLLLRGQVPAL